MLSPHVWVTHHDGGLVTVAVNPLVKSCYDAYHMVSLYLDPIFGSHPMIGFCYNMYLAIALCAGVAPHDGILLQYI